MHTKHIQLDGKKNKEGNFMKKEKEKEEGKYIHASFIGKVSMRMKEYIKTPYGRKREKYTKLYIYPHQKKKKKKFT